MASINDDGDLTIGLPDGEPVTILDCTPVAGLRMIAAVAEALDMTRAEMFAAIDPGPAPGGDEDDEAGEEDGRPDLGQDDDDGDVEQ